ncbi:MAG: NADH-quinone oxidoreductase subunit C [Melioribacteraceae bacterium]|nr:NADH-quinone oxidoreductase subunit C [Melioribacteraceae bacterium]MCF8264614.1 NADH-quinone oxidoreductase subunit C [Melioribacteraceae bacterium]MCF8414461.1 NADH-quinone oxidoreductase subunit C [Melioribacteraceae bacterium]
MNLKENVETKLNSLSDDIILEASEFRNQLSFTVSGESIVEIAKLIKEDPELKFELCEDVTAIDWAKRTKRFTVVYHIYSLLLKERIRIKAVIDNDDFEIESVSSIWPSANWYERETWDMYGIKFLNHPDLRRMYMPEEFEYHPLRKEFPVMGIPGSLPLPDKED